MEMVPLRKGSREDIPNPLPVLGRGPARGQLGWPHTAPQTLVLKTLSSPTLLSHRPAQRTRPPATQHQGHFLRPGTNGALPGKCWIKELPEAHVGGQSWKGCGVLQMPVPILQRQKQRPGQRSHSLGKALHHPYLTVSSQPFWVGCPIYR